MNQPIKIVVKKKTLGTIVINSNVYSLPIYKVTLYLRGHTFGELSCDDCECKNNLIVGSIIAEELRNTIKEKFNLTTSAGNFIMD